MKKNTSKFFKIAMKNGKSSRFFFLYVKTIAPRLSQHGDLSVVLFKAINKIQPKVSVKSIKIAGRSRSIPYVLPKNKRESIGIRWILEATKKNKNEKEALFIEIINSLKNTGTAKRYRDEIHKIAENSRSFAHYRWW